jgi:hypothetical protein
VWGTYTATLAVTEGIVWAPELWAGVITLTGLVGLGLSLLILPPKEGSRPT